MIIYVGSTRPAKVEGAREAVRAIAAIDDRFRQADIRPQDLGDAGPSMPMTEAAVIEGARCRTATLLAREGPCRSSGTPIAGGSPDRAWFAVGLEGGLDLLRLPDGSPRYALRTWACVSDGRRWSYGAGGAVIVPDAVARAVTAGRELGEVIDELAGAEVRGSRGAWGLLTRDLVGRRDAFRVAVISAFAPFYNPVSYD